MWLNERSWDAQIVLGYLGRPEIITKVLIEGKVMWRWKGREIWRYYTAGLKMEKGTLSQEMQDGDSLSKLEKPRKQVLL